MQLFDLTGETAIVTGASKGLGESFAHALAQAGAERFSVVILGGGVHHGLGYNLEVLVGGEQGRAHNDFVKGVG